MRVIAWMCVSELGISSGVTVIMNCGLWTQGSVWCVHNLVSSLYVSFTWKLLMVHEACAFNLTLLSTASLTFSNSTFCPHSVFICFLWISEQTAIISLYNVNWLVFITETVCVYCAVRTETSNVIHASFPLPFHDFSVHFGNNDYRLRSTGTCSLVDGYRRFRRTCFLQFKVKERHQRLEGAAPSRRWWFSTRLHFGCFEFLFKSALSFNFPKCCKSSEVLYVYVCVYSMCTVRFVSGTTRLAGHMRLSRHSHSAGKLHVKNNIQVFFVHT